MTLYELHDRPDVENPVVILGLDGWIDAGSAAAKALSTTIDQLDVSPVATFDTETLLDLRARRPTLHLLDGVATDLEWPKIELSCATDQGGNGILILHGAEPDHAWRTFSREVVDLAIDFGARMVLGLGAYPAPAPHTRPPRMSCTAATPELAELDGLLRGTLEVPAGVQAAIEMEAHERGLPSIGLWAQVPHYVSAMPYPAAALALVESLNTIGELELGLRSLPAEALTARERLDRLVEESDEHVELVRQLEETQDESDENPSPENLPSGDELAAQLQQYLRDQPE